MNRTSLATSCGCNEPVAYVVDTQAPFPPAGPGWCEADAADTHASEVAADLLPWFPLHHYADARLAGGVYRFFAWESPHGKHMGALQFTGSGLMGAGPVLEAPGGLATAGANQGEVSTNVGAGGEPIPSPTAQCVAWVPTTSNAQANAVATAISNNAAGAPTQWAGGGSFDQTIGGTLFRFVMWSPAGTTQHNVSVFQCTPPKAANVASITTPAPATSTATTVALVAGAAVVALAGGWYLLK